MIINQRGSMMLMTMFVISSLIIISAAFVVLMINDRIASERHRKGAQAEALAQAGLESAIAQLRTDYRASTDWYDADINGVAVTQSDTNYYNFIPATNFGEGTYTVQLKNETATSDKIWVQSVGQVGDDVRTLRAYLKMDNPADWTVVQVGWFAV